MAAIPPSRSLTIFLDVDGVLVEHIDHPLQQEKIQGLCKKKYPDRKMDPEKYDYGDSRFTRLEWLQAASELFDPLSLEEINDFLETAQKTHRVSIVISSSWRIKLSLQELKEQIFDRTDFAHLIVDKVQDEVQERGLEIQAYLDQKFNKNDPNNLYLIFDDVSFGMNLSMLFHWVPIDPDLLFCDEDKDAALLKLEDCFAPQECVE